MKKANEPLEKYIVIQGKKMYISISGESENVILCLTGLGSYSPIIEMRALSSYLKDKYTVITLDYLGYGMSQEPSSERFIENIVNDIHSAMVELGYKKYSIVGHSLSGIYMLLYIIKYPNEVNNFIGIDISVPQQINYMEEELKKQYEKRVKEYDKFSIFSHLKIRYRAIKFLKQINDYSYSRKDLKLFADMSIKSVKSKTIINELQNMKKNFHAVQGLNFPETTNILLLISSESENAIPNWYKWHNELLNTQGKIIRIKSSHIMHLQYPKLVAQNIKLFISQDNRNKS